MFWEKVNWVVVINWLIELSFAVSFENTLCFLSEKHDKGRLFIYFFPILFLFLSFFLCFILKFIKNVLKSSWNRLKSAKKTIPLQGAGRVKFWDY